MKIVWTDLALASLDEIAAYIEYNFSISVSQRSLSKIVRSVEVLSTSPDIGMAMPEFAEYGDVRSLRYKQNQIVYRKKDDVVQIVIVWDGRRSQEDMLDLVLDHFSNLA